MPEDLYAALGVQNNVPPEEIRQAYRRRALQTHPDRLQPGATAAEKAYAEEQFRKVNNAYEILSDEEKRRIYDQHGQWPPPEVQQDPRNNSFNSPFFNEPFFNDPFFTQTSGASSSRSRRHYNPPGFTDPFALFNSIFGDMHRSFDDPFFADAGPFGSQPFGSFNRNPFGHLQMNNVFPAIDGPFQGQTSNFQSSSRGVRTHGDGNGHWVSQSRMTQTINGVTESVWKRTDSTGNKHVTHTNSSGQERYFINGVEQPNERNLPPPPYPGPQIVSTPRHAIEKSRDRKDPYIHHTGSYAPVNEDQTYAQEHKKQWWKRVK
ncbi:hypothetical protein EW145_g1397 [Phellinidium pouzarii]|uniref:J domain-containing protein n=1 Tax=Phellinidium pouzarii TaxID=167371 RepID=A0A4S4LFB8_9AGAM|nr:hypothetical protein EW145_g1397 [Phellinidium pouzarii]